MAAILPSRMPRSPEYHGEPVPSMMWPLVMTRSNAGGVWAWTAAVAIRIDKTTSLGCNSTFCFLLAFGVGRRRPLDSRHGTGSTSLLRACNATPSCDPNCERQPFVGSEMAWDQRDTVSSVPARRRLPVPQAASACSDDVRRMRPDLERARREAGGAGGRPSDGTGHRTDFGDRHQDRVAEKHADCRRNSDAEYGDGRRLIAA